jgi:hypothetical protein
MTQRKVHFLYTPTQRKVHFLYTLTQRKIHYLHTMTQKKTHVKHVVILVKYIYFLTCHLNTILTQQSCTQSLIKIGLYLDHQCLYPRFTQRGQPNRTPANCRTAECVGVCVCVCVCAGACVRVCVYISLQRGAPHIHSAGIFLICSMPAVFSFLPCQHLGHVEMYIYSLPSILSSLCSLAPGRHRTGERSRRQH